MNILIKYGERLLDFSFSVQTSLRAGKLTTGTKKTVPDDVKVYNPAFDITPAGNIKAIIAERGVIEKPNARKIKGHFANSG